VGRHKYETQGEMFGSYRIKMGPNLASKEIMTKETKKKRRKHKSNDCIIFLNILSRVRGFT
jgi:hypothetical protein